MKWLIVIAGLILGAILGLLAEAVLSPSFKHTCYIPLLVMTTLGAAIGILIGERLHARFRVPEQNLDHLPVATADFIKLVITQMRYRRKVRADVMAELTAHFEDGLKDCKTDEEKEQTAKKLISEFGDVKLLGVLLRRAKKRCRPLWRTVTARAFQAFGLLVLYFIIHVVLFITGKPGITVDYVAELNRAVRPAPDESLNAAPLYQRAVELYNRPSDDFLLFFVQNHNEIKVEYAHTAEITAEQISQLFADPCHPDIQQKKTEIQERVTDTLGGFLSNDYHEATPAQRKYIARWLQEQTQAVDLIVAASRKPYYWQKYDSRESSDMMAILLPHLSRYRDITRLILWRGSASAAEGRHQAAFSDIRASYRLGRHVKQGGTLIEQLVGIAVESLSVQTLADILSRFDIHAAQLAALQKDFEEITAAEDFAPNFQTEKFVAYDTIQRCFTQDRLGGGHLCLKGLQRLSDMVGGDFFEASFERKGWLAPIHILFTHPNRRQSMEMVDDFYCFLDDVVTKTPARLREEDIDIEDHAMTIVEGNILLEILMPALGRIAELCHRSETSVHATITLLALLRYEQDKGFYPDSLHELGNAGYLEQLPIDLYSDEPLVYRRTGDDFILYSLGRDFDDDGGAYSKWGEGADDGDQVFWPLETPREKEERLQRQREKEHRHLKRPPNKKRGK